MNFKKLIRCGVLFGTIAAISSCNRYIDATNGIVKIEQSSLKFYVDSNMLTFKSNIVMIRDTEKVYPKFFNIKLPKKIKGYAFSNTSDFGVYYNKKQVVFIKIYLENSKVQTDTVYTPLKEEVMNFIQLELLTGGGKYDLKKIPFHRDRKTVFIRKGYAMILLYNIRKKDYELFASYANSFKFLPPRSR